VLGVFWLKRSDMDDPSRVKRDVSWAKEKKVSTDRCLKRHEQYKRREEEKKVVPGHREDRRRVFTPGIKKWKGVFEDGKRNEQIRLSRGGEGESISRRAQGSFLGAGHLYRQGACLSAGKGFQRGSPDVRVSNGKSNRLGNKKTGGNPAVAEHKSRHVGVEKCYMRAKRGGGKGCAQDSGRGRTHGRVRGKAKTKSLDPEVKNPSRRGTPGWAKTGGKQRVGHVKR